MNDALFTDEPAPESSAMFTDEPAPESKAGWSDVPANAVKDVVGLGKSLAGTAKTLVDPGNLMESAVAGSFEPTKEKLTQDVKSLAAMPGEMVNQMAHPVESFKEHPVNTALAAAGIVSPALGALGKAGEAIGMQGPIIDMVGKAGNTASQIPKEVGDYINSKSQMMALRQMGAPPGMAKKLSPTPEGQIQAQRALGQYGLDSGIVDFAKGPEGMAQRHGQLIKDTGNQLGAIRKAADQAGPAYADGELISLVRQKLDPIYQKGVTPENPTARGIEGTEASSYKKALESLQDAKQTHQGIADLSTKLRHDAQKANKMQLAPGPYTEVAKIASDINNAHIAQKVGPQAAAKYENLLREYGAQKKIGEFLKNRVAGEVKREGVGGVFGNLLQKALDEAGYRSIAKGMNKISGGGKNLPDYFKDYVHHLEEEPEK